MSHLKRFNFRPIRLNVLIIVLLVGSLLGSNGIQAVITLKSQYDTLTNSTIQANFEGARNLSVTVNSIIANMMRSLDVTGKLVLERGETLENSTHTLRAILDGKQPLFNSAFLADEKGVIRSSILESADSLRQQMNSRIIERALHEKKPLVSAPFLTTNGQLTVLFTMPIFDQQRQYRGFVGGTIYMQQENGLRDIFDHVSRSKRGTYAYIVDRNGELLYNPINQRKDEVIGSNEIEGMMNLRGTGSLVQAKGQSYIAGYVPVPHVGWGVVFQSPASTVSDAMLALMKSQMLYMLPLFAVLLALCLWIASRLTKPFVQLTVAAQEVTLGGRLQAPPFKNHWNYEAHHLAQAMMRAVGNLQHQADRMTERALTDKLTGLANRAALEEWLADWQIANIDYTLLVLDIDHFKSVNDNFGHQTGDEVLVHVAQILMDEAGEEDLVCRFGGEEFVVLLPRQSDEIGQNFAELIRERIEGTISPTGKHITVSIGLASYPNHGESFSTLFEIADQALYHAKRTGRNRTVSARNHPRQVI